MKRKVLLLNKGESVLDVITWQNAVCLLIKGNAKVPYDYEHFYKIPVSVNSAKRIIAEKRFEAIVESDEDGIERGYFVLPTAIVLVEYVHIPYKSASINKKNVLKRDNHRCGYCDGTLSESTGTIDHIVPISRWKEFKDKGLVKGKTPNSWKNIVACCRKCNCKKDNKTPEEAGMTLKVKPYVPSKDYLVFHGINTDTYETWTRWVRIGDFLS